MEDYLDKIAKDGGAYNWGDHMLSAESLEAYFDRWHNKTDKNVYALDERGRLASIYYIELITILNPMYSVVAKLENLDILKTKVTALLNTTTTRTSASLLKEEHPALYEQYKEIVYILEKLISIIDTQIKGLTIVQGATP